MSKKILYLLALLSLLIAACTEKIDLKLDETYTRLVVDGYIKTDTQQYKINLTKTSDYFANVPSPRVVNATVSIDDGTTLFPLTETVPGISGVYVTNDNFSGIVGREYKLSIHLAEAINGKSDYSATCKMLRDTKLDSIETIFESAIGKEGIWEIKIYAQDPPGKNYYLLNLYHNGILWSDSINKVVVSDNQLFEGNYIRGLKAFFIDNSRKYQTLYVNDTIMMELSAITKEYFDFINQVKQSGFNIPFFTGPPANVVGNIDNGAVGFFAAYSSSYAKARVTR